MVHYPLVWHGNLASLLHHFDDTHGGTRTGRTSAAWYGSPLSQYGCGSSSSSSLSGGGHEQERNQQEEVTMTTPAMAAPAGVITVATDWQSVDGRPVLRIITTSVQADIPVVLLSPLPPHMVTNSIHPNGNSLTNIVMDNATDSNSLASTTTVLSLREADDESTRRFRPGARTLITTAQNSNSNSSGHHHVPTNLLLCRPVIRRLGCRLDRQTIHGSMDRVGSWPARRWSHRLPSAVPT
jgi:hypothetical protein